MGKGFRGLGRKDWDFCYMKNCSKFTIRFEVERALDY